MSELLAPPDGGAPQTRSWLLVLVACTEGRSLMAIRPAARFPARDGPLTECCGQGVTNPASGFAHLILYVNRPGILPTIVKNRLSHDLTGLRSILSFDRTSIEPHDLVLARGNEERFTVGDTNAGGRASLLNMFGIDPR